MEEVFGPCVSVELPVAERGGNASGCSEVLVIPFSNGTVPSLACLWIQLALAEVAREFLNIVLCVIFLACFCFYDGIYA